MHSHSWSWLVSVPNPSADHFVSVFAPDMARNETRDLPI